MSHMKAHWEQDVYIRKSEMAEYKVRKILTEQKTNGYSYSENRNQIASVEGTKQIIDIKGCPLSADRPIESG
jgi:hypothetical protein